MGDHSHRRGRHGDDEIGAMTTGDMGDGGGRGGGEVEVGKGSEKLRRYQ